MNKNTARALGILVVVGGVCAALPFQKRGNDGERAATSPEAESIEWRSNDFSLEITARDQPLTGVSDSDERSKSPAFGSGGGAFVQSPASLDNVSQPPPLPSAYQSASAASSQGNSNNGLRVPGEQTATTQASGATSTTSALPTVAITHQISDGDTLEALAEKHLGSRLRWTEIYNANPEILDDPEVLPLGVTIVILPGIRPLTTESANDAGPLVPVSSGDLLKFREANE